MNHKPHLFVSSVLLLFAGCGQAQTTSNTPTNLQSVAHPKNDIPVIDDFTRAKAAKLHVNDIKEFRFTGPQFVRFENDPIIVKDKTDIGRYITALSHAYRRPTSITNGINILDIVFLSRHGKEVPSQRFYFNLSNDLDCFGPEFRKETLALQARIAKKDKEAQSTHQPRP